MLEKIEKIHGVGLLHNIDGRALKFSSTQLIYADNGRGKSTLASILRAVSTGDSKVISERKTVDQETAPEISLSFGSGHKVTFSKGAWSEQRPEILVFDAEFIEKNVHSGGSVTPGQRKNLLQFALGPTAVKARTEEEEATKASVAANASVAQITAELSGYHQCMSLPVFQRLVPIDESVARLEINALRKRVQVAQDLSKILARRLPGQIPSPEFDLGAFFEILNLSLKDVEEDAEKIVSKHFSNAAHNGVEKWISDGQRFDNGEQCPYCAQDTSALALIRAYRTHFNDEYEELKKKVSLLDRGLSCGLRTQLCKLSKRPAPQLMLLLLLGRMT